MNIDKAGYLFLTVTGTMATTLVLPEMLYNNAPIELIMFVGGISGLVFGVYKLTKR